MIYESINIENCYDYSFHKELEGEDNGDKYVSFIFTFNNRFDTTYYVTITSFYFSPKWFSVDFFDSEQYEKNKDVEITNRVYLNTNTFDSFKVLSTVFTIIKDFYEHNKNILEGICFTADSKRRNIYKNIIKRFFPNWVLTKDDFDHEENMYVINYEFKQLV